MRPWLLREIELVKPKCIATLGNVPLGAITGGRQTIGAVPRYAGGSAGGSVSRICALSSGEPALQPKSGACVRAGRGRAGAGPPRPVRF